MHHVSHTMHLVSHTVHCASHTVHDMIIGPMLCNVKFKIFAIFQGVNCSKLPTNHFSTLKVLFFSRFYPFQWAGLTKVEYFFYNCLRFKKSLLSLEYSHLVLQPRSCKRSDTLLQKSLLLLSTWREYFYSQPFHFSSQPFHFSSQPKK